MVPCQGSYEFARPGCLLRDCTAREAESLPYSFDGKWCAFPRPCFLLWACNAWGRRPIKHTRKSGIIQPPLLHSGGKGHPVCFLQAAVWSDLPVFYLFSYLKQRFIPWEQKKTLQSRKKVLQYHQEIGNGSSFKIFWEDTSYEEVSCIVLGCCDGSGPVRRGFR